MAKKRKTRKRRKAGKARRAGKARKKRATRRTAAPKAPLLSQMSAYRADLMAQQAALQNEIDKLSEAISVLGGGASPKRATRRAKKRGPGRPRGATSGFRTGSLKSYIMKVMRPGQVIAVKDVAAAVRRAGYRTQSSNFANQVSNAMAKMPKLRKVSRGKFRA